MRNRSGGRYGYGIPRHLYGRFHRLGAGIPEENPIGERYVAKPLGQPLLPRHAIEVRGMPNFPRLGGQSLNEMWMGMAKHVDSHTRREVEISLAIHRPQIGAFAPLEFDVCPCISPKHRRH